MELYILQVITTRNLPRSGIALFARLGILTVVLLKIQISCDVAACQLVIFPDVSHDLRKAFFKSRHENSSDFGTACSNKWRQKATAMNWHPPIDTVLRGGAEK
jgi:hypothetical protein